MDDKLVCQTTKDAEHLQQFAKFYLANLVFLPSFKKIYQVKENHIFDRLA
jgi:hypothetical protein